MAELSDDDLNKHVQIKLQETSTIWLLDIPGTWILSDNDEAAKIQAANEKYHARLVRTTAETDAFAERAAQTLSSSRKDKEAQAAGSKTATAETQASEADLQDTLASLARIQFKGKSVTELTIEAVHRFAKTRQRAHSKLHTTMYRLPAEKKAKGVQMVCLGHAELPPD